MPEAGLTRGVVTGVYRYIYPQNQSLEIILCTNYSRWRQAASI